MSHAWDQSGEANSPRSPCYLPLSAAPQRDYHPLGYLLRGQGMQSNVRPHNSQVANSPLHTSHLRPWDGPNSYMLRFTTHAGRTLYSLSSMTWGGVQVQPKNMFFSSRLSVLAICSRRMRTARLGYVETGFVALFDNYATIVDFASYPNSADRQEYFSPLGPLQAQDQFRLAGNERNPAFDRRVEFDLSLMIALACPSS